ncbi:MAG: tyrosine-type recombinase/integrase [Desulfovibrio sp.]|nr:tyrosine-type recombinase/integrase [Desulfovibrio sp.]
MYQELNSQKKSLITDQYNFRNHLTGLAHKKPDELLTIDILKLRKSVEAKNLSPATVKHVLVLLRMLINWAVRQGICPMRDSSKLHFDIPKLDNEKTEMLTHEQIQAYEAALAKEPDQNLAALFRLALVTGMRKFALLNLKWEDCDFKNHVIVLRGEVAKKGKTEFIPMNNAACAILQGIQRTESEYVSPGATVGPVRPSAEWRSDSRKTRACQRTSGHSTVCGMPMPRFWCPAGKCPSTLSRNSLRTAAQR